MIINISGSWMIDLTRRSIQTFQRELLINRISSDLWKKQIRLLTSIRFKISIHSIHENSSPTWSYKSIPRKEKFQKIPKNRTLDLRNQNTFRQDSCVPRFNVNINISISRSRCTRVVINFDRNESERFHGRLVLSSEREEKKNNK